DGDNGSRRAEDARRRAEFGAAAPFAMSPFSSSTASSFSTAPTSTFTFGTSSTYSRRGARAATATNEDGADNALGLRREQPPEASGTARATSRVKTAEISA
ncbi:unnamed protein product, partial [Laminaria digitata]